jgi:hypothetical protein
MNNNEILKPLQDTFELAQELVRLAQAEDWVTMEVLAINYQQHMTILTDASYLKSISDAHLTEAAKEMIIKIQDINSELDTFTALQHEKIASELRQISQASRALQAYGR